MGLQRRTPLKSKSPLQRGSGLKSNPPQGFQSRPASRLQSDPDKGLKRTPLKVCPEKLQQQRERERERARERANKKARERMDNPPAPRKKTELPRKPPQAKKAPPAPRKRPSRPTMTAEERQCRQVVAERSEGMCEKCGLPSGLEKAHRIARSQGGKWEPSNILDLCHTCHHGNHSTPQLAYDHGWHLRGHMTVTTTAPVLMRKGWRVGWALLDDQGGVEWVDGPAWDEMHMTPRS